MFVFWHLFSTFEQSSWLKLKKFNENLTVKVQYQFHPYCKNLKILIFSLKKLVFSKNSKICFWKNSFFAAILNFSWKNSIFSRKFEILLQKTRKFRILDIFLRRFPKILKENFIFFWNSEFFLKNSTFFSKILKLLSEQLESFTEILIFSRKFWNFSDKNLENFEF